MKYLGPQEDVPAGKKYMISTRENSDYKWQKGADVIGALEIQSEPDFDFRKEPKSMPVLDREEAFDHCIEIWDELKLRDEFVKACEAIPPETCCCGLIPDDDETIKSFAKALNNGWMKAVNQRLRSEDRRFKIDAFVWNWHNATGKAETNVLLIRFILLQRQSVTGY